MSPPEDGAFNSVTARKIFFQVGIAVLLVLTGSHVVLSRHTGGSPERLMDIPTGGSAEYIQMAQHGTMAGPAPFRYRFLVPLLVAHIPVPAETAFRIVTFTCLGLLYFIAMLVADSLGMSLRAQLIALISVFCARTHAFNYWNPLLADAWGLLAMFVMLLALIRNWDLLFTVVSVLGTLGRESVMFLTPAIFTPNRWKRAVLPVLLTVLAFVLPRILLRTPEQDVVRFYGAYHPLPKFAALQFWKSIAISWSYLWLILPLGMIFTPQRWRSIIFRSLGWVSLGTCIALFMAEDTERMVAYLTPFVFLAVGFLVDHARSRALDVTLLILAPLHLLIMLATVVFPVHRHGLISASLRLELLVVAVVTTIVVLAITVGSKNRTSPVNSFR